MKKTPIIVLGIIIIAVIASVAWIVVSRAPVENPQSPDTSGFPLADNTPFADQNDGNFLNDADVAEDPVNPGDYYLGYQTFGPNTVEDPPYLIAFTKETNYFNIILLHEPLGEVRLSAERYLMTKFGISGEQLCGLNYTIGVPNSVNSAYSSMNLGFSFCPGAVKLP